MRRNFEVTSGEIVGAHVPDDDLEGWKESLRKGGFSSEEINGILEHLNEGMGHDRREIEAAIQRTTKFLEQKVRRKLRESEMDELRKAIEQVHKNKKAMDAAKENK